MNKANPDKCTIELIRYANNMAPRNPRAGILRICDGGLAPFIGERNRSKPMHTNKIDAMLTPIMEVPVPHTNGASIAASRYVANIPDHITLCTLYA